MLGEIDRAKIVITNYHAFKLRERNPEQWLVTPETARLLKHWRSDGFQGVRPFFCQIEAVETAIWLAEVAPKMGARYGKFWEHIRNANADANPELLRLALKLATGAGKTTVMAMIIAWQTVNAAPNGRRQGYSPGDRRLARREASDPGDRGADAPARHARIGGQEEIVVLNDEAHHCYREREKDAEGETEADLRGRRRTRPRRTTKPPGCGFQGSRA